MAKKYRIQQKLSDSTFETLHPETNADIVVVSAEGINATNVKDALQEINDNIKAATGGGVVTGVKGDAETEYRLGQVNITKANIGLGNVDNTADSAKPISTAQQTALDLKVDKSVYNEFSTSTSTTITNHTNRIKAIEDLGIATNYATKTELATSSGNAKTQAISEANSYTDTQIQSIMGEGVAEAYNSFKELQDLLAGEMGSVTGGLIGTVNSHTTQITNIVNGTTPVSKATLAETATNATSANYATSAGSAATAGSAESANTANTATTADKLSVSQTFTASGDVSGTCTWNNSTGSATANLTLANSGVTAGSYSSVAVDEKGRVTAGAQVVVVEGTGLTTANLAVGGLYFKTL